MPHRLEVGDLVTFAHRDNMYTGSIIADVATGPNDSHCFRVQTQNVIKDGTHKLVKPFSVDYPASALSLVRVHGM
jgi:tagatose-1,6-bisphosphate aldolase non-catalytic subunit AgaZ/GatZ